MIELKDVQEYAQQIAEAIAAVLKIDVEIADKNLIRVAGTGIHSHKVGRSMNRQGYIYREVIRHGHELVIDNHHPGTPRRALRHDPLAQLIDRLRDRSSGADLATSGRRRADDLATSSEASASRVAALAPRGSITWERRCPAAR